MKIKILIMYMVAVTLMALTAGLVMAQNTEIKILNRAVIKIDAMTCGGCFTTISQGLSSLDGYSGMGANLFRKMIAVDFTDPLTPDRISQKLAEIGYPGNLDSVETISEKESFVFLESKRTGFAANSSGSCCSRGYTGNAQTDDGSTGLLPQTGGSCCTLPSSGAQPTQDL